MVVPERAGRPLLLIDLAVPRDIDPACAELPGVTLLDVDELQRQVARHQLVRRTEARKAEGIVEDEIQAFAGWLGSLEVMPTLTALRTRADDVVSGLLAENEGRWESLCAADRERVEKLARTAVSRLLHEPTVRVRQLDAEHRHARLSAAARAVRARRAAGGGRARRGRRGPPAAAPRRELTPLRVGTRGSALALVQARWVAERLPGAEIVEITTSGDQARGGRRQVALGRHHRGRAGGGRDRPRGALGEGRAGRAGGGLRAGGDPAAGGGATTSSCGAVGARRARRLLAALPAARGSAPPRCAGARSCSPCGRTSRSSSCAATSTRGCASSTRARSDAIVLAAAGLERLGIERAAQALDFVPAPGQGTLALEIAGRRRARRGPRSTRCMTRPPSRPSRAERAAVRVLEASCHTPVGIHAQDGTIRGFVGLPDGSAWVADEVAGEDGEALARRMLAAGAGELLAQAEAMA